MKNQILFDSFKELFDKVKEAKEMPTKSCNRIWNSVDEILEDLGMETMTRLDEAGLSELKLKNVIEDKHFSKDEISMIEEVREDILNRYLVNPIKLTTAINSYVKRIEK
jgi:hypothetical protein